MRLIGKLLFYPIFIINLAVAAMLVASGWSGHLSVSSFPILSLTGMVFPVLFAANVLFCFLWLIFYRRAMWLPILAIVCVAGPLLTYSPLRIPKSATDGSEEISLLSYNVHYFYSNKSDIGPVDKENQVIKYIAGSGADIICLQEANIYRLGDIMSDNKDFLPSNRNWCHSRVCAILSRWPILEHREIETYGGAEILYCRVLAGTDTLAIISCHLQSIGLSREEKNEYSNMVARQQDAPNLAGIKTTVRKLAAASAKRAAQIETLAEIIDGETASRIILCGDFNDTPLSYSHTVISDRLVDIYAKSGFGPGISYNENRMYFRIDHMFCSQSVKPLECRVDHSINASDHYPVKARLKFQ